MVIRSRSMLLGAVLLLVSAALADTLSVELSDVAYIAGPIRGQSRGRALIATTLPAKVQHANIDCACLQMPSPLLPGEPGTVNIEAFALTTSWEPSRVSWDFPWRAPGGDLDTVRASFFPTWAGDSHAIWLDITSCARMWQAGRGAYGLILKRPESEGGGFALEGVRIREALVAARVKYWYTPVQQ